MVEVTRKEYLVEITAPGVYRTFRIDKIVAVYSFDEDFNPKVGLAVDGDEEPWSMSASSTDEAIWAARVLSEIINEYLTESKETLWQKILKKLKWSEKSKRYMNAEEMTQMYLTLSRIFKTPLIYVD